MQVIKAIWDFFQNQILGMKWLYAVIGSGLSALGLNLTDRWAGSLQFFIYDVIKIVVLLCFLIFLISYIQSYFPPERSRKILGRFHGIGANTVAALLGTVTPFCPDGRPRLTASAHEYFWLQNRRYLCCSRSCYRGCRRHSD